MDETRRLAYLSVMGIDCYLQRESRPVASVGLVDAPAVDREADKEQSPARHSLPGLQDPADANQRPEEDPSQNEVPEEKQAQKREKRSEASSESRPESRSETRPEAGQQKAAAKNAIAPLRFSLQYYRISEQLAVINEVPYLGSARPENEVQNLLAAILRAIGQDIDLPGPDRFNWPLSADDDASGRRAPEAYQALQGFLRKRLRNNTMRVVVVFGNQLEDLFASSGVDQQLNAVCGQIIHTHSLDAMLKVPALKRSVWDSVRAIPELLQ